MNLEFASALDDIAGGAPLAVRQGDDERAAARAGGMRWVQARTRDSGVFRGMPVAVLSAVLEAATVEGLILEFGVHPGRSLLAHRADRLVPGSVLVFDDLLGLPGLRAARAACVRGVRDGHRHALRIHCRRRAWTRGRGPDRLVAFPSGALDAADPRLAPVDSPEKVRIDADRASLRVRKTALWVGDRTVARVDEMFLQFAVPSSFRFRNPRVPIRHAQLR